MTRFTKYTLTVAVLALAAVATAFAVTYSYHRRGYFSFGGEWLIPGVVVAVWWIGKEVKRIFKVMEDSENGEIH